MSWDFAGALTGEMGQRIGWALMHFLWQGVVVAALAGVVLEMLRRRSARARYVVACAGLGLMVVMPLVTATMVSPTPVAREQMMQAPVAARLEIPPAPPADRGGQLAPRGAASPAPLSAAPSVAGISGRDWLRAQVTMLLPWAVLAWAIGVLGMGLWQMSGWALVLRMRRSGVMLRDAAVTRTFERLRKRMCVRLPVRLLESAIVRTPVVIGWLRPAILLPASVLSGLTGEQLAAILAHELAHVKRLDCLVRMLQAGVETVLFFHPAVWWMSAQVTQESEHCCDDMALTVFGDREGYARALAAVAGAWEPGMVAAGGGKLLPRLRRILRAPAGGSARPGLVSALAMGVIVATIVVAVSCVSQRDKPAAQGPGTRPGAVAMAPAIIEAAQTELMPEPDTFYELAPGRTYAQDHNDPGPASLILGMAYAQANEFVNRTALRKLYRLPPGVSSVHGNGYLMRYHPIGEGEDLLVFVSGDFKRVKRVLLTGEVRALMAAAMTMPVRTTWTGPGNDHSTGLDFSAVLGWTDQANEAAPMLAKDAEGGGISVHLADAVKELVHERKVWVLCALLGHSNVEVQIYAARALGELGDPRGVAALLAAAKNNANPAKGSESATLHGMFQDALRDALKKITGEDRFDNWDAWVRSRYLNPTAAPTTYAQPGVFYITGEAGQPGCYNLNNAATVAQAMKIAGFPSQLKEHFVVQVTSRAANHQESFRQVKSPELLGSGGGGPVLDGDVIMILDDRKGWKGAAGEKLTIMPAKHADEVGGVHLLGVPRAGGYAITRTETTLEQMLVLVQMTPEAMQRSTAHLFRRAAGKSDETVDLDLEKLLEGTEPDRFLQPNDVVTVTPKEREKAATPVERNPMVKAQVQLLTGDQGNPLEEKDRVSIDIKGAGELAKLAAFFPEMGQGKEGSTPAGWIAGAEVKFVRKDGSVAKIAVSANDQLTVWSEGNGDWKVRGDFAGYVAELKKKREGK